MSCHRGHLKKFVNIVRWGDADKWQMDVSNVGHWSDSTFVRLWRDHCDELGQMAAIPFVCPRGKKESGCASNFHSEWFAHIQICWLHSIGLFFISLFGGDSLVICRCHFTPTPYATSGCNTRIHARLICLVEQLFKRPAGGMKWMKLWMVEDIFLPPRILSRIKNYWELGPV